MEYSIRRAVIEDAPAIAQVHVQSWKSTYRGIVPDTYLASLNVEARTAMWRGTIEKRTSLLFVAEAEVGVVGFVCGGELREPIEGYDAEIYAIYLLREQQFRGIGRALVQTIAEALNGEAYMSVVVWVLEKNPAVSFYKRLGGILIAQKGIEIGSLEFVELCFAWPNLDALVQIS